jgi:hypothetical protein
MSRHSNARGVRKICQRVCRPILQPVTGQQLAAAASSGLGQSATGLVLMFAPPAPPSSVMNSRRLIQSPRLDHLVGAQYQPGRNLMTNCLCGLEIDDQLEVARLLDRKIIRCYAAE